MSGILTGGWEFVWAAYGVTAAVLAGYTLSLVVRLRSERLRREREASRASEVSS